MVETIVNSIQLGIQFICCAAAAVCTIRGAYRAGGMLTMYYGVCFLGTLYWTLFSFFYGHTPDVFYVSEISWYASFLFLWNLMHQLAPEAERQYRHPLSQLIVIIPILFCTYYIISGYLIGYLGWGDCLGDLVSEFLMYLLMRHAVRGLLYIRREKSGENRRMIYCVVLAFCMLEQLLWAVSCVWLGDTMANPYYWLDILVTISMVLFLPAVRKAVKTA